ncbi:MAG TPA: ATP-dependent DNA ligase [Actinomycetota bacterium]|nr:ATP-dependent DNA ligase [Actinomycetota bacterium]
MDLPVQPPVKPMLAKSVPEIPEGMLYEPKFDGFRCIVFRDGDEVELGSRNERPLTRYFPEVVEAVKQHLPERCVLDGEIVVAQGGGLDFEALQQRIHPAESRINMLALKTPAAYIAFDLLALGQESSMHRPFSERRAALEVAMESSGAPIFLTPATDSLDLARKWFSAFEGAGLDGVIAKPSTIPYSPDKRTMFKIKHQRTADCVVAGFRWHKSGPVVGSLLLGLYDDAGALHHVGVAAAFTMAERKRLLDDLAPHRPEPGESHPWNEWSDWERIPGGAGNRWNAKKDMSWEPLRPELVVEVGYDHMEGTRFRHVARFKRWRTDRTPESCTFSQLEVPAAYQLADILSGG